MKLKRLTAIPALGSLVAFVAKAGTVIGGAIAVGIFVLALCGLLYTAAKALNALRTMQQRRDAQLTNDVEKLAPMALATLDRADPVMERLSQLQEEDVVLVPEEETEMTDEEFIAWADSLKTWAVLFREKLSDPWVDTGNRLYGASNELRTLLLDVSHWEAVYTAVGATKDQRIRESGFYSWVPEELAPVRPEDK